MGSVKSKIADQDAVLGGDVAPVGKIALLFSRLANRQPNISLEAFMENCSMKSPVLRKQLFRAFDKNNDGVISFFDFHSVMHLFIDNHIGFNEQLKFLFTLLDVDCDRYIDKNDMRIILSESLALRNIRMSPASINKIIDETFNTYDSDLDNKLNIENVRSMVIDQPDWIDIFFSKTCYTLMAS